MKGELIETECAHCKQPLVYIALGNQRRKYHPECVPLVKRSTAKNYNETLKLGPEEFKATSRVANMTQRETAAKLATWEAMESLLRGEEATLAPISQQAIMFIERSALLKLRKALAPHYVELTNQ